MSERKILKEVSMWKPPLLSSRFLLMRPLPRDRRVCEVPWRHRHLRSIVGFVGFVGFVGQELVEWDARRGGGQVVD